jgi:abhydrolase domain-containing protein 17
MILLRAAVRVLMIVIAAVYSVIVILAVFSDHLIFQPHAPSYGPDGLTLEAQGAVQTFTVPCEGGNLAAAFLPSPGAYYTLLYSHGNGEDMGDVLPMLEDYRRAGFAVFAYDYNGYGQSAGRASEAAVYRNAEAAYDFLTGPLHVPADRVMAFGHSLGAAASIHLASRRPVAGLIVLAPFLSAFRLVTQVQIVPWDKFDNARVIRSVRCPVLVAHGRRDEVIPFGHGARIYELANQPKEYVWLDGARHNDVMQVANRPFLAAIQSFAAQVWALHRP